MPCDPGLAALAALAAGRFDDLPAFFIGSPEVYNASGCQKLLFQGIPLEPESDLKSWSKTWSIL